MIAKLFLLYLFASFINRNFVFSCPEVLKSVCSLKCQEINGELDLDCSQAQDIKTLVRSLRFSNKTIGKLEISNNPSLFKQIIPGKIFQQMKIRQLDLSRNAITEISPRAFFGQEDSLTMLNLASNQLKLVPDLSTLKNLESLDLTGNQFASNDLKPFLIEQNKRLRVLQIEPEKRAFLQPNSPVAATISKPPATANVPNAAPASSLASDSVAGVGSSVPAAASSDAVAALAAPAANPVSALLGASLLTELVRNLPQVVSSLAAARSQQPQNQLLNPNMDLQQLLGAAPAQGGIPADMMAQMIRLYAQQQNLTIIPANEMTSERSASGAPVSKPQPGTKPTLDFAKLALQFLNDPKAQLPPVAELPTDIVNAVIGGGVIPGLDLSQTEAVKKKYMDQMFGPSPPISTAYDLSQDSKKLSSNDSKAPLSIVQIQQSIAANKLPDLKRIPAETTEKLLETDTTTTPKPNGSNLISVWQRNAAAPSFPLDDLNLKTSISDLDLAANSHTYTLYIVLGLVLVTLLTSLLIGYFCWRLHKKRQETGQIRQQNDAAGTSVFLGTPPAVGGAPLKKSRAQPNLGTLRPQLDEAPTILSFHDESSVFNFGAARQNGGGGATAPKQSTPNLARRPLHPVAATSKTARPNLENPQDNKRSSSSRYNWSIVTEKVNESFQALKNKI